MARILAIDYGRKRLGLAVSDETRLIASPYGSLLNDAQLFSSLDKLIKSYNIDAFLLGKPIHEGENSFLPEVLAFADKLISVFSFPVYLYDESLSSKNSRNFLITTGKRGKKLKHALDSYAAQSFLAEFLLCCEKGKAELYIPSSGIK